MLTLFSEPSLELYYNLYKQAKKIKWKLQGREFPHYAGHPAVDQSVCRGLDELKIPYNYNPRDAGSVAEHVHVLANVDALKMAIRLKKNGRIKRLTAGVNIVVSPADHDHVVSSPEIDLYTVNSEWVQACYIREDARLSGRIGIWYAGVDAGYWDIGKQAGLARPPRVLFYLKRPEYTLVDECMAVLDAQGIPYDRIEYGKYKLPEFRQKLMGTDIVVYFVEQESQGIALFEIWASNTPTFVWNPGYWQYNMKNFRSSAAPYLTSKTGRFFRDKLEFEALIRDENIVSECTPRAWVLEHGTHKRAAEVFLNAIGYEY